MAWAMMIPMIQQMMQQGQGGGSRTPWEAQSSMTKPGLLGSSGGMPGNPFAMGGNIANIFQGLFGNSGSPYEKSGNVFEKYMREAMGNLQPYNAMGQGAMGDWRAGLNEMKDPAAFMNNILGKYSTSPMAQQELKQAQNSQNAAASASGMLGGGAFMKGAADYAQDITSRDMQRYLDNVLGINRERMGGLGQMSGMGLQSGMGIAQLLQQLAQGRGQAAYGQEAGRQNDKNSLWGGIMNMFF